MFSDPLKYELQISQTNYQEMESKSFIKVDDDAVSMQYNTKRAGSSNLVPNQTFIM